MSGETRISIKIIGPDKMPITSRDTMFAGKLTAGAFTELAGIMVGLIAKDLK